MHYLIVKITKITTTKKIIDQFFTKVTLKLKSKSSLYAIYVKLTLRLYFYSEKSQYLQKIIYQIFKRITSFGG